MKVAFVLYGGMGQTSTRSKNIDAEYIDPQICYDHYKHFGVLKDDYDVYFHTWESPYSTKAMELYKPKHCVIESTPKFNVHEKYYGTHCRFYSQKMATDMLQEDYDLVFLTRFDLAWHVPFDFSSYNPKYLYVQHSNWLEKNEGVSGAREWNTHHLCDWWFLGSSKTIKKLNRNYSKLQQYLTPSMLMPNKYLKNGMMRSPQHVAARQMVNDSRVPVRYVLNRDEDHCLVRNCLSGVDPQTKKNIWKVEDGLYHLTYETENRTYTTL